MGFELDKKKAADKFIKALENREVDKPIIKLLKFINSLSNFYTTSSCAGRIILLHEFGKRKIDNSFVLKEHEKLNINDFLDETFFKNFKGIVWLKQEPFILHVVSKTLNDSIEMLNLGLSSGLKHSGIFVFKPERYIVELNGTQNLSVPVVENGKFLITKGYFLYLLKIAERKLQKNKEIREKFEKLIIKNYAK